MELPLSRRLERVVLGQAAAGDRTVLRRCPIGIPEN
jgi:hypothetical protein